MAEFLAKIKELFQNLFSMIKGWFTKKQEPDEPDDPDVPKPGIPGEVICYYGCPNSARVKKLQLEKHLFH